jgi:1-aminocyclopropane-1-carboxylate deaminase/D-cysteine desulfhydrase-like pyridoxal-dependent ACC family enzyme
MVWAVMTSIEKGVFNAGERVLMVHTGGLQGNRSS